MAFERRRNGRKYFYSAKRIAGKVVKAFHGAGDHGRMVELECRKIARKRKEELRRRNEFIADLWHLESIARLAKQASRQAVYSTYLLAGFQRSAHYKWTRKESDMDIPTLASLQEKGPTTQVETVAPKHDADSTNLVSRPPANSFWPESIDETIRLVMAGRRDLLGHLRSQIAEVPDLWRQVSDLTRVAIEGWARKISRGNVEFQESIILAAMEERKQLHGESRTIMERTVIDRFVISKLQMAYFDLATSCADESTFYSKVGMAIEKRRASGEHQLREATRQLAKIKIIQEEIEPSSPVSASIRLFDPNSSHGRHVA